MAKITFWQKVLETLQRYRQAQSQTEVDSIGKLQMAAKKRRAEFAVEKERAAQAKTTKAQDSLAASRKRVTEAEIAYANAIQAWDDKQFRR